MSVVLKIVLISITLLYIVVLIKAIKRKNLQISFSIFWIVSGILLVIALAIPNLVEKISYKLGFITPSNMVFCITIFIAFYLIFSITLKLAQENKKNISLIQEISILKKKVRNLERKMENNNEK